MQVNKKRSEIFWLYHNPGYEDYLISPVKFRYEEGYKPYAGVPYPDFLTSEDAIELCQKYIERIFKKDFINKLKSKGKRIEAIKVRITFEEIPDETE